MSKLGLMGGTFDPVHYGHLIIAEAARHAFSLDEVVFIPTGQPPHKRDQEVAAPHHRYAMTVLATLDNPFFTVSSSEIDRGGISYAVDTLREFRHIYGPGAELYFILGADAILDLLTWKDVDEVGRLCEFAAVERPGYGLEELAAKLADKPALFAKVHYFQAPLVEVSSSDIRQRIRDGRSIKYLVPESVETYIQKYGLYGL